MVEAIKLKALKQINCRRLDDGELSRALDGVIEYLVSAGCVADGFTDAKRLTTIKKVRKALGYIRP